MREIAGTTRFASLSPDGNYLLFSTDSITVLRNLPEEKAETLFPFPINNVVWSPDSKMFCYKTFWKYVNDQTGPFSDLFVYRLADRRSLQLYAGQIELYSPGGEVTESVDGMAWLSSKELLFHCGANFPMRIETGELWRDGHALRAENTVILNAEDPKTGVVLPQRIWVRGVPADSSYLLYSKSESAYSTHFIDATSHLYYLSGKRPGLTDTLPDPDAREINCQTYAEVGIIPGTSILYFVKDGEWNNKILIFKDPKTFKKILRRSIEYFPSEDFRFIMDPDEKMIAWFDNQGLNVYDLYGKNLQVIREDFPETRINEYSSPAFGELVGWTEN